jgi:hypothetical protein
MGKANVCFDQEKTLLLTGEFVHPFVGGGVLDAPRFDLDASPSASDAPQ